MEKRLIWITLGAVTLLLVLSFLLLFSTDIGRGASSARDWIGSFFSSAFR